MIVTQFMLHSLKNIITCKYASLLHYIDILTKITLKQLFKFIFYFSSDLFTYNKIKIHRNNSFSKKKTISAQISH